MSLDISSFTSSLPISTPLLILLSLILFIAIFLFIIRVRPLPGVYYSPPYHPIIGHALHLQQNMSRNADNLYQHALRAIGLGHSTYQICIPFQPPLIHLLTPEAMECVLKTQFESFEKGELLRSKFDEMLGNGIFNSDGKQWRNQRKIASHMFSHRVLQDKMATVFQSHSETFLKILSERAETGETIDLQSLFNRFTLDCIGEIAFGVDFHSLELNDPPPFTVAFDRAQEIVTWRFITPAPVWKCSQFFRIGIERDFLTHINTINQFVFDLIDRRLQKLANTDEYDSDTIRTGGDDLLSLFIRDALKKGEPIDRVFLRDLALNFMLAGRDTTASALSHMFWFLNDKPEAQQRLLNELNAELDRANLPPNAPITASVVKALPFADAVFSEVCRLSSPVPCNTKECVKSCTLPDGTFIPAGTFILWCPYVLNRLTTIWGPDALEFKPERWLVEVGNEEKGEKAGQKDEYSGDFTGSSDSKYRLRPISNYVYTSFNAGPRLCLGKAMAFLEAKIIALSILRDFQFTVQPGFKPKVKLSITMPFVRGLPVTIQRRK